MNWRGTVAYKHNPHVYLPKFESAKNPFAKTEPQNAPAQAAPAKSAAVADRPSPVLTPAKMNPAKKAFTPSYSFPAPQSPNWAARLNPMAIFRGSSASSARNITAVQTELSLDSVRVIENDLHDAEVEVVPLKSRPARPAGGKSGEPEEAWNDLGTKIFGANAV